MFIEEEGIYSTYMKEKYKKVPNEVGPYAEGKEVSPAWMRAKGLRYGGQDGGGHYWISKNGTKYYFDDKKQGSSTGTDSGGTDVSGSDNFNVNSGNSNYTPSGYAILTTNAVTVPLEPIIYWPAGGNAGGNISPSNSIAADNMPRANVGSGIKFPLGHIANSLETTGKLNAISSKDDVTNSNLVPQNQTDVTEPQSLPLGQSVSPTSSGSTSSGDCLCPFPYGGGAFTFLALPSDATEQAQAIGDDELMFENFKDVLEKKYKKNIIVTRSEQLFFNEKSFSQYHKKCTGEKLSHNEYKALWHIYQGEHNFFGNQLTMTRTEIQDLQKRFVYRKICIKKNSGITGANKIDLDNDPSFMELVKIFNINKDKNSQLITVYGMCRGQAIDGHPSYNIRKPPPSLTMSLPGFIWAGGEDYDGVNRKSTTAHMDLGMDSFDLVAHHLDGIWYELDRVGLPNTTFMNLSFAIMLHELIEAHYIQNQAYYKSQTNEFEEVRAYLGLSGVATFDIYMLAHMKALLAEAREYKVTDVFHKWECMDERGNTSNDCAKYSNGATLIIMYKKVAEDEYIKCTFAIRIKAKKFYFDEISTKRQTPPSGDRDWKTFGCIMFRKKEGNFDPLLPGVRPNLGGVMTTTNVRLNKSEYIEQRQNYINEAKNR